MEKHPGLDAEEEVASYRHRKQVQLGHLPTESRAGGTVSEPLAVPLENRNNHSSPPAGLDAKRCLLLRTTNLLLLLLISWIRKGSFWNV